MPKRKIIFDSEMAYKRIVFSTATPNDQGFSIPNDVIQFNRFLKNPVILRQHKWDEPPLGRMTDIRLEGGQWTGVPVFHRITQESRDYDDMWQQGFLNACSIGGYKELASTGKLIRDKEGKMVPEIWVDADGNAKATLFDLYEVSMVSIPSNMDAVEQAAMLAAKCYDEINLNEIQEQITTLSSKLSSMETPQTPAAEATTTTAAPAEGTTLAATPAQTTTEPAPAAAPTTLSVEPAVPNTPVNTLPPVITDAIKNEGKTGLGAQILDAWNAMIGLLTGASASNNKPDADKMLGAAPTPTDLPKVLPGKDAVNNDKLPPIPNKLEAAIALATEKLKAAMTAKDKADKKDATKEDKEAYEKAKMEADDAVEMCTKMEAGDGDALPSELGTPSVGTLASAAQSVAATPQQTTLNSSIKMKTVAELQAEKVKLAAKPEHSVRMSAIGHTKTLTQLSADENGKRIINRVQSKDASAEISDYAIYLQAMRNDPKFKGLFDKVRIIQNAEESRLSSYQTRAAYTDAGFSIDKIISRLASGRADFYGRDNRMHEVTTLTATDDFLASPDLLAIDFLDLAIFKLFPASGWKNEIAIFGAQETENNTGLVWANITADPAITMGNKPVNPTDYTYTDDAVSLNLTPYWMQPMVWTPLTMHQLRYDQMSTGWAQAFAKLGTYIDDNLIYTLASYVPHQSIVYSNGKIWTNPTPTYQFTLNGNADDPNAFYYNPLFAGTLNSPTLNDVIRVEQIYNKQNFALEGERPYAVIDPTTDALIAQTEQTQSLLTRWVNSGGADLEKFKHTVFSQRSRVAIFDPVTAQVKNPNSVIPNSAVSANLCFIPSQVAIGMGKLDVFMIQDPSAYGYRMSCDVRMGISPLRKNNAGIALWTYGPQQVS